MANFDPGVEVAYRQWFAQWARRLGLDPDPDASEHHSDYREAFQRGLGPTWQPEPGQFR